MQHRLFKVSIFFLFVMIFGVRALDGSSVRANINGPQNSSTGAPGEQTCAGCHSGIAVNSGGGIFTLTGLPANYTPNQVIPLALSLSKASSSQFGFQVTAVDDSGKQAGTLALTPGGNTTVLSTAMVGGNTRQYVGQTLPGSAITGADIGSWTFSWRAPAQPVGRVTFYIAGLIGNNNGNTSGDFVYTMTKSIQGSGSSSPLGTVSSTSAASFSQNGTLASQAIAAAFGVGLTQNTVSATTSPLPTLLDGAEIRVKDSANVERNAGLFFVSPGQFNYLVPQGTMNGPATITVLRNGTPVAQGSITIDTLAPGLFSANADGKGVPAAVILRVRGTASSFEPIAQLNPQTQRFDPIQIDLGPQTDQVFLVCFGTGFRNNTALSAVTATIGGTNASVQFAGPQGTLAGLEQTNILIPRSLAGRSTPLDVVFSVAGRTANTLQIRVK